MAWPYGMKDTILPPMSNKNARRNEDIEMKRMNEMKGRKVVLLSYAVLPFLSFAFTFFQHSQNYISI
jgi:hypothetical protein